MKAAFVTAFALFGAALSAPTIKARQSGAVTISITNDQTGRSAQAEIGVNGELVSINDKFGGDNSAIVENGRVLGSSAQMIVLIPNTKCDFTDANGDLIASITDRQTFADLDGNNEAAIPVDLTDAFIGCGVHNY